MHSDKARTIKQPPACDCSSLLIGFYELEDCVIYLPGSTPFNCQLNPLLKLDFDFQNATAKFTSNTYQFCESPVKIYSCGKSLSCSESCKSPALTCNAQIISATLSPGGNQLELALDAGFPNCAFESNSEGFWFALPIH